MKILVVDSTTESQAQLAMKIGSLDPVDLETLDIEVNLASEQDLLKRINKSDVLVIGPVLEKRAIGVAQKAKKASPNIEIIMFATDEAYENGAYRISHYVRVRKVLAESAPSHDLTQELLNIHEDLCSRGIMRKGKLTVLAQAKGGVGTTTICAALGELCSNLKQRTILWDLDIESKDLSKALKVNGIGAEMVSKWIDGSEEISRKTLHTALESLSPSVSLLGTPEDMATSIDLVGHPDCVPIIERIIEVSRFTHENIIVDVGGRIGPATGTLLLAADLVLVVIDDSLLGLVAAHNYLRYLASILPSHDSLKVLCSGTKLSQQEIAAHIDEVKIFGRATWSLPAIPYDPAGASWPGKGKTLYGLGNKKTRSAFDVVGEEFRRVEKETPVPEADQEAEERQKLEFDLHRVGNLSV